MKIEISHSIDCCKKIPDSLIKIKNANTSRHRQESNMTMTTKTQY